MSGRTRTRTRTVRRTRWRQAVLALGTLLLGAGHAAAGGGFATVFTDNAVDVFAAGDSGVVFRSYGGAGWLRSDLGPQALHAGLAAQGVLWLVGDGGRILHSTDRGGSWSEQVVAGGAVSLFAIAAADNGCLITAGSAGTVLRSCDAGASWTPIPVGTASNLRALRMQGAIGWLAGDGGTLMRTTDGGNAWESVAVPLAVDFRGVDFHRAEVWAAGHGPVALRSTSLGLGWEAVPLGIDARTDVNHVRVTAGMVELAGGGGFIRRSTDGGVTWSYLIHPLHGSITAVCWWNGGPAGFACSGDTRAVMSTGDGGAHWTLPPGTTTTYTWTIEQNILAGSSRGNTFAVRDPDSPVVFGALGGDVFRSGDRGENWQHLGLIAGVTKINALIVSPADSSVLVALVDNPDRILRSTDRGVQWNPVLEIDFSEYGVPLEQDPDRPNRMLFAPEDGRLYESLDAGASFHLLSNPNFISPCDIEIVPGSPDVVYVGDGLTGFGNATLWRSTDGGQTFTPAYSSPGSEIPGIATSRLAPALALSTNWSTGGLWKSEDTGASWAPAYAAQPAWGIAIAPDDPNVWSLGMYGSGLSFITLDHGATFTRITLPSANYGMIGLDRSTFLAQQATGIWKLRIRQDVPVTAVQQLTLLAPNGGEHLFAGQTTAVFWSGINVPLVNLEFRAAPGQPWQMLSTVDAQQGWVAWTAPAPAAPAAQLRISDAWDGTPADTCDAAFSIDAATDASVPGRGIELVCEGLDPATHDVRLRYRLPVAAPVRVEVFDVRGRRIAVLADGPAAAGDHHVRFPGPRNTAVALARGVVLVRLRSGDVTRTLKLPLPH